MNSDKLKSIISKKANGNSDISMQLYQMFFFEKILDRVSVSKYKHNIILKGGLLLSSIIGEDMRTTKDMDASLRSIALEKENIYEIFNEILSIDLKDNTHFEIIDIKDIRAEDEYGGFRINVLGVFEQLKVNMFIEVSTGDVITPKEIEYKYKCIFEEREIPIFAYTIETILAEKFETIITRSVLNTRLKDFYDIYKVFDENVNKEQLLSAIKNTFRNRETNIDSEEFKEVVHLLRNDNTMINNWIKYSNKFYYAKDISFDDIMNKLDKIIELINE